MVQGYQQVLTMRPGQKLIQASWLSVDILGVGRFVTGHGECYLGSRGGVTGISTGGQEE